ncbi:MAG TPA: metallophosphoesterase [Actinomycetota bacterium]|nr:metallophosphoesterase [Actinomycetota bacterium]
MSARPPLRVAAVGDLHLGLDSGGLLAPELAGVEELADLFLFAGDATRHGDPAEAQVLATELETISLPKVGVLGNHDYHSDQQELITKHLESSGMTVLEQQATTLEVAGRRVGIAGTKGFGGGFRDAGGSDFGEPEMKAFIRHTQEIAAGLRAALDSLDDVEVRIALLHYSPIAATLFGEKPEIFAFLGSYLLEEAVDDGRADVAFHGHAHAGAETGFTAGGVPVHNVAHPVIRAAYKIFELPERYG